MDQVEVINKTFDIIRSFDDPVSKHCPPESLITNETRKDIKTCCTNLSAFLLEKNRRYGNSALEPIRIFSQDGPIAQLKSRIDDKLSRIHNKTKDGMNKNDLVDLTGYLVLLCVAYGWTDFNDLID